MACDFTPKGQNNKLSENEMKAYLLDGGLSAFVSGENVKIKEIRDYFEGLAKEAVAVERESGELRKKGILGRIYDSETLPETYRDRVRRMGTEYAAASQDEADAIADTVIASEGEEAALDIARGMTLGGDVSSAIFAKVLDNTYNRERAATESGNAALAYEEAEKWADISKEYDERAREMGRFTSMIQRFYQKSPMGLMVKLQKNALEKLDDEVVRGQEKTIKEMIEEIKDTKEFLDFMSDKVREELSKGKPTQRQTKKEKWVKKVDNFFENLKIKNNQGVSYSVIIPPALYNAAIEIIKQSVFASKSIYEAVQQGVAHISKGLGGAFDSATFEKEMTDALTDLYTEVTEKEWQKLSRNLMPKQSGTNLKIATDIGKINGYLSRRNDAERGKVLAALVSKMEQMGVLPLEKVGEAIGDEEVLSDYIANLSDAQKAEVAEFLQSRIADQKTETKREAVLAQTTKILEAKIASLREQIATGKRIQKETKDKGEQDPAIKQLRDTIAELEKELDEKVPDEEAAKKRLEQRKEFIRNKIKDLHRQISNRKRDIRPKKEGGLSDIELENLEAVEEQLQKVLDSVAPKPDKPPKTFEQKVKATTKALEKEIAYYQGLIDRSEYDIAKEGEKIDTPAISALREKLKELKAVQKKWQDNVIASVRPDLAPDWYRQNIINKYLKKLKRMTPEQKEQFMRRAMLSIIANDGLDYNEFKQLLADVMGYSDVTPELRAQVEQWAKDINDVEVKRKALLEQRTPQAMLELDLAQLKADVANFALNEKLYKRPNAVYTFMSAMQLNTLGLVSIVKNLSYNVFERPLRFANDLYRTLLEYGLQYASQTFGKLIGSPTYNADFNAFLGAKGYIRGFKEGWSEGGKTVMTGQQKIDYYQSQQFNTRIRPKEASKKMIQMVQGRIARIKASGGSELLNTEHSLNEIMDTILQATAGWHAEAIARLLTLFDKPFRYAAERSRADQIAKLRFADEITTETDLDIFAKLPLEESRRIYYQRLIAQGKTVEDAMAEAEEKAKEVEAEIKAYGDKAIFTQSNLLAELVEGASDGLRKLRDDKSGTNFATNAAQIALKTQFLYVRIPSNVAWSVLNYALPPVSITQGLYYLGLAAHKKKQGLPYNQDLETGKKWLVHALVGLTIAPLALAYFVPALTGGDDEDETPSEYAAQKTYAPPGHLNWSMVGRLLTGSKDQTHRKDDFTTNLSWLGSFGAYLKMQGVIKEKGLEKFVSGANKEEELALADKLSTYMLYTLGSAGMSSMIDGMGSLNSPDGGATALVNSMNVLMNVAQPATFAQWNKANMDYNYRLAEDGFLDRVKNSVLARSSAARLIAKQKPPENITIWGEVDNREDTSFKGDLKRYFGFSEGRKNNFAPTLFDLATTTQDSKFLPNPPARKISVGGKDIELSRELWDSLKMDVGQTRALALNSYFSGDGKTFSGDAFLNQKYMTSDGTEKEYTIDEKQKILKALYSKAAKYGRQQFIIKNEAAVTDLLREKGVSEENIIEFKNKMVGLIDDSPEEE